jgi:RNA polymerase sigma factor (sigma-70 family)
MRRHVDPEDLVQNALMNTFRNLKRFDPEGTGTFLGYLRQALLNQIRDEVRRLRARPSTECLPEDLGSTDTSPLERVMGRETMERYEDALLRLSEKDRLAVILRVELDLSYPEIAQSMQSSSANAVRMRVVRAILRLAEILDE